MIVDLAATPDDYAKWDAYCDMHKDAWWWHRTGWIKYSAACGVQCDNFSFYVEQNGKIVGICPLILENGHLKFGGNPSPAPIACNAEAAAEMWAHIKTVMEKNNALEYWIRGKPIFNDGVWSDLSWRTQVIRVKEHDSIKHLRKSYRNLALSTKYNVTKSTDVRDVKLLQAMHIKQAGRITRPQQTWDLMAAWISSGYAYTMIATNSDGDCVGAIYIYKYKGREYYGHAATIEQNVNHKLLYEAIRTSDSDSFELGWQGHAENKKEENIEFFLRGFGGIAEPFVVSRCSRLCD